MVDMLRSTYAFLNAMPNVKPSAHLWQITARLMPILYIQSVYNPIANPSKIEWIPIAI